MSSPFDTTPKNRCGFDIQICLPRQLPSPFDPGQGNGRRIAIELSGDRSRPTGIKEEKWAV
jgi:hypothetical protein